jgi:hypothetical protein
MNDWERTDSLITPVALFTRFCLLLFLLVGLCAAMAGCGSRSSFVPLGSAPPPGTFPPAHPKLCTATILQRLPTAQRYLELGTCTATVPGGGTVRDITGDAIMKLQECTCQHSGNALLIQGNKEKGYVTAFGYSQQQVHLWGTVLYVWPAEP